MGTTDLRQRFAQGVEPSIVAFVGSAHVLALVLGVTCFSWQGLKVLAVLYLLTGLGVTVGYHRLLTHRSFQAAAPVRRTLAVLGLLSGEGPPMFWVAHHRKHHELSDKPGDPHTPVDGLGWAHWLWMFPTLNRRLLGTLYSRYAPDLARDRFCFRLERTYLRWHAGLAVALLVTGWVTDGWRMGLSWLAYGYFVRMVLVLHSTWLVNSASHSYGYRNYPTDDDSRNNGMVSLLAFGEGWHNNHHHSQVAANHGHLGWEVDASFLVILVAAWLSAALAFFTGGEPLVSDVKVYDRRTAKVVTWFSKSKTVARLPQA